MWQCYISYGKHLNQNAIASLTEKRLVRVCSTLLQMQKIQTIIFTIANTIHM